MSLFIFIETASQARNQFKNRNDFRGSKCTIFAIIQDSLWKDQFLQPLLASSGFQNTLAGGRFDAFLAKFNSAGIRLWGTYYGGNDLDIAYDCTVDGNSNVYVSGETNSTSGISSSGFQNSIGGSSDAFFVKFDSTVARQWATYYGGSDYDRGTGCTMDGNGTIYMTGSTSFSSGIASGGFQNIYGGNYDAFLVKFNNAGILQWSIYYGGGGNDMKLAANRKGIVVCICRAQLGSRPLPLFHRMLLQGRCTVFVLSPQIP